MTGPLRFAPATIDDAEYWADLWTDVDPDDPSDPVLMRHFWRNQPADQVTERFIAIAPDGERIGGAAHFHGPWEKMPTRYGQVRAGLFARHTSRDRLDEAFAFAEGRSRESGTAVFSTWVLENEAERIDIMSSRGYAVERRAKLWQVDLVANRERIESIAGSSRERMRSQGFQVTTLDKVGGEEPVHRFWKLFEVTTPDMPSTVPYVSIPFDDFVRGWMDAPSVRQDRIWIALEGDDMVGYSMLTYPPERGNVWNNGTATVREARGKGIARALKAESMLQAIELGVPHV
ncbi:MAG: GNAT family N-acetyltransferase, partial [Actinobacteria bacterium]|nr:GNAT family N-acetyltransferase [Actinomycetota bacterium]